LEIVGFNDCEALITLTGKVKVRRLESMFEVLVTWNVQ